MFRFNASLPVSIGLARAFTLTTKYVLTQSVMGLPKISESGLVQPS